MIFPSTAKEQQKIVTTIKYTARWWHSQLENISLHKVFVRLSLAERQGLVNKESCGYGDYKIFIPCKHLGKNKKERNKKILEFLLKNT